MSLKKKLNSCKKSWMSKVGLRGLTPMRGLLEHMTGADLSSDILSKWEAG